MSRYDYTLLMPCLNEEKTVGGCIDEAKSAIGTLGISAEILIADNKSTDHSAEIAAGHGARVVTVTDKGYGNAVIGGTNAAEGRYIILADCDGSYRLDDIEGFIRKLENGADLVVGNRFMGSIEKGAMPFSHRYIGVPLLSFLGRLRFKTEVGDFHCGIRAFDRDKALSLGLECSGMEFSTEIIAKFAMSGSVITEIPANLRKDGRNGRSHLRTIPDGIRHLKVIICGFNGGKR